MILLYNFPKIVYNGKAGRCQLRRCTQVAEGSGFEIVWSVRFCGSRTPWYLGPFRICCLRSAEELLHIFLRFAKRGGCEWGAILRVTSGTHKFSSNHYSKWLEIVSVAFRGDLANPWYFWLLPLFYTFSKLNIYGFSTLCLRFLHLVLNQPETRKALKIQHGDVSKWS